jgi:hypothetical protein
MRTKMECLPHEYGKWRFGVEEEKTKRDRIVGREGEGRKALRFEYSEK